VGVFARSTDLLYLAGAPGERPDRLYLGPVAIDPRKDPTNELRGGRELGEALSRVLLAEAQEGRAPFICSDRYQLTALAAFYTKGRPHTYCLNMGKRRLNQYDLWGGWEQLVGKDALFVTGGDVSRARFYIGALKHWGAFEDGQCLETVEVRRGDTLIKTYTISRLEGYTGYAWTPERATY